MTKLRPLPTITRQLIKYGFFGGLSATGSWISFFILEELLNVHFGIALIMAFLLWIYPSYYFQSRWVFLSRTSTAGFLIFVSSYGASLPAYFAGMTLLVGCLDWNPSAAYALLIAVISLGLFALMKLLVFPKMRRV